MKYLNTKQMQEANEKYGRPIYKKYTKSGVPVYFFTVDDKPRSKMQFKLNNSEVYSCAFKLNVAKVLNI